MKEKHIHKLKRHKYSSGNIIYFCVLPDCNYKIAPALAVGKRAICNRCNQPFIMNEYSIRLAKPHCTDCHQTKDRLDTSITLSPFQQAKDNLSLADRLKSVTVVEREDEI